MACNTMMDWCNMMAFNAMVHWWIVVNQWFMISDFMQVS